MIFGIPKYRLFILYQIQNLETYLMNRVRLRIAKMNILYGKLGKTNFLKHPPLQIKFMLAIAYNFGIN